MPLYNQTICNTEESSQKLICVECWGEAHLPILHDYWLHWTYWLVAALKNLDAAQVSQDLQADGFYKEWEWQKETKGRKLTLQTVELTVYSRVSRFIDTRSNVSIVIIYRNGLNKLPQGTGTPPSQQTKFHLTQTCDCLDCFVLWLGIEYRSSNHRRRNIASPRGWYIDCTALEFTLSSGMQ